MVRPLLVAAWLTVVEVAIVFARAYDALQGADERRRVVAASATVLASACLLVWALGSAAVRSLGATGASEQAPARRRISRRVGWLAGAVATGAVGAVLWLGTTGRQAKALPGRTVLVMLVALGAGVIAGWLAGRIAHHMRDPGAQRTWVPTLVLLLLGTAGVVLDALLFVRLYPVLHAALTCGSIAVAVLGAAMAPASPRADHLGHVGVLLVGIGLLSIMPWTLHRLRSAPNAWFVAQQNAPVLGKVLDGLRSGREREMLRLPAGDGPRTASSPSGRSGIDLRGRDILLITVDALRADRLEAYGGGQIAPHMDRIAKRAMVFERAYTPRPHTSWALGSLLTGQFLGARARLQPRAAHKTLADLLGRHGYQTAAFYPPSVFYTDGEKLGRLRDRGFGFDERRVRRASAPRRVQAALEYVRQARPDAPVLVWVHLFEPHEPYRPPQRFSRGARAEQRYEGEVAAADEAVGTLVRRFRELRPGATVLLTADHGEEFGEHGGYYHGTTLYDEQVRIPLLWSAPGVVHAGRSPRPVELVDIAPTLLSAAGVPPSSQMNGEDLGAVLAGHVRAGPRHAFARVGDRRMVTDGRWKLICMAGGPGCRLYDLREDPGEHDNVADARPREVRRLRRVLGKFLANMVKRKPQADHAGRVLDRARVGDPTAGPDLVPLLGAEDASVRERAAEAIGRLGHRPARPILARLREQDPAARVRAAAAVASLRLGDRDALPAVRDVLERSNDQTRLRRAARILAERGDASGESVLIQWAKDSRAKVQARKSALDALAKIRSRDAMQPLVRLLDHLELRTAAAKALGRIFAIRPDAPCAPERGVRGSRARRAARALAKALQGEPYTPARMAEARALARLGHPGTGALVRKQLQHDTPLPNGQRILRDCEWLRARGKRANASAVPRTP
jgi:arylsulfatase A-like enzyme